MNAQDVVYWRERCHRAEGLLARARSAMTMTPGRRALLAKLGDLRPGQALSATALVGVMGFNKYEIRDVLCDLEGMGWVERVAPANQVEKCRLVDMGYRLAHMAVPPEPVEAAASGTEAAGLPLWQG